MRPGGPPQGGAATPSGSARLPADHAHGPGTGGPGDTTPTGHGAGLARRG
jgi:hypothetical protein